MGGQAANIECDVVKKDDGNMGCDWEAYLQTDLIGEFDSDMIPAENNVQ